VAYFLSYRYTPYRRGVLYLKNEPHF
jgi:hypothetical protein